MSLPPDLIAVAERRIVHTESDTPVLLVMHAPVSHSCANGDWACWVTITVGDQPAHEFEVGGIDSLQALSCALGGLRSLLREVFDGVEDLRGFDESRGGPGLPVVVNATEEDEAELVQHLLEAETLRPNPSSLDGKSARERSAFFVTGPCSCDPTSRDWRTDRKVRRMGFGAGSLRYLSQTGAFALAVNGCVFKEPPGETEVGVERSVSVEMPPDGSIGRLSAGAREDPDFRPYRENGAFGGRGFVPPWDANQLPGGGSSPYPSLPAHKASRDVRLWWLEDMGIENGMLLLWKDDAGGSHGRYFAWRFAKHPDGIPADRTMNATRCVAVLNTPTLTACEIDVGAEGAAAEILQQVDKLVALGPHGDGDRMLLHPEELYVQVTDLGALTTLHYDLRPDADPEHQLVRDIQEHVRALHEKAASTLPAGWK